MLREISIRDLAVVDHLELTLDSGLTVLTGETGAGKSILLTALGLALGDRADVGCIRPGAQRAEVGLTFVLDDAPAARAWLDEQQMAEEEDCILRRTVSVDGRSRAYINGSPVTLQSLQEFSQLLLEIHGQHAHVQLMRPQEQRRLLDAAAGNEENLAVMESLFRHWREARSALSGIESRSKDRESRLELLNFQIDELESSGVAEKDYDALVEEHGRQAHVEKILEIGERELETLYEADSDSIAQRLSQANRGLAELKSWVPEFETHLILLDEALVQIKEAAQGLRRELDRQEADPARLRLLDDQLAEIHRFARKHQIRPEEVKGMLQKLRDERDGLRGSDEASEQLKRDVASLEAQYRVQSQMVGQRRMEAAKGLEVAVADLVHDLGMPKATILFKIDREEGGEPRPFGDEQVEIQVSANPGLPPRPLAKVASGGELSRISLALQVALTAGKRVPTLIFDEVDSGIGGGVAEVVGQKLRQLGASLQVLSVTHLPQVAAQAHHHLKVTKALEGEMTRTAVHLLDDAGRIDEVARMLGGRVMTPQTLAHAREMLQQGAVAP
jgi:DNA repair protein RecN (Recombination protein N)